MIRNTANGLLEGTGVGDLTDAWTHNPFAEPTAYSASHAGSPLFQASYGRDRLGRIDTRTESAAGASFADTYGYALSGRLDTVHRGGALASDYGFDTNGNRNSHRINQIFFGLRPLIQTTATICMIQVGGICSGFIFRV